MTKIRFEPRKHGCTVTGIQGIQQTQKHEDSGACEVSANIKICRIYLIFIYFESCICIKLNSQINKFIVLNNYSLYS